MTSPIRKKKTAPVNNEQATPVDLTSLKAAALAFAGKVIGEQYDRDDLSAGDRRQVKMSLVAEVDGRRLTINADGSLDVGPDSVRASSVGAKPAEIIAWICGKMNATTRAATLAEMAEVFAKHGNTLPVSNADIEEAEEAMKRLRQKVDQPVRGSVRVNYSAEPPKLSVVG